jgi:site-specific DNA-methyltransferase (cytosine-N4-specific)
MLRLLWHDYRYFPYERRLAEREARLLFGVKPEAADDGLVLRTKRAVDADAARLTYFKAVQNGVATIVPDQARLEASANGNGAGWDAVAEPVPSLRRQSTRYSAHGLHEYRGKFNPQVVRAIGNLFQLEESAWVLDPFCGSGTTILESAHIGWSCVGLDMNPLGILIANAKVTAFTAAPRTLSRQAEALSERLAALADSGDDDWHERLPEPDYLQKWFRVPVLKQMAALLREIEAVKPKELQDVFRVILSDLCRDISLQDPGDLRIRRRKDPPETFPVIEMFTEAVQSKVGAVVRARAHVQPKNSTTQIAAFGDSRQAAAALGPILARCKATGFDAAITSPPYATALPYMDTQRLSLALFGLVGSKDLRSGEKQLIGNREIQDRERGQLEQQLHRNAARLPPKVSAFCLRLLELADHDTHGFRRRNVPALVYKYLGDMASMFESVREVIRPGGRYALLVGRNTTCLRKEEVTIDTPELLAGVAESRGWAVEEALTFDTYQRYDVHQENSIREEVLLLLRRP